MDFLLTDKQKQFLFDEYYIDSKGLDAAVYKGWQNYFIDNFDWKLVDIGTHARGQKYGTLILTAKKDKSVRYESLVIFQGDDYNKLILLSGKEST